MLNIRRFLHCVAWSYDSGMRWICKNKNLLQCSIRNLQYFHLVILAEEIWQFRLLWHWSLLSLPICRFFLFYSSLSFLSFLPSFCKSSVCWIWFVLKIFTFEVIWTFSPGIQRYSQVYQKYSPESRAIWNLSHRSSCILESSLLSQGKEYMGKC